MATTAKAQAVRVICTPEQHGPNPKTKPGSIHAAPVKAVRAASMLKQACAEITIGGRA
jgi:hypothetical protein